MSVNFHTLALRQRVVTTIQKHKWRHALFSIANGLEQVFCHIGTETQYNRIRALNVRKFVAQTARQMSLVSTPVSIACATVRPSGGRTTSCAHDRA